MAFNLCRNFKVYDDGNGVLGSISAPFLSVILNISKQKNTSDSFTNKYYYIGPVTSHAML